MSCEHCDDYEASGPRYHDHPLAQGKSAIGLDGIEVKVIELTTMNHEDLSGLPLRA